MNAPSRLCHASASKPRPITSTRLHALAEQAITASNTLTLACHAGQTVNDTQYARIDQAAYQARRDLLVFLEHEHGIDAAMADQLGALL